MNIQLANDYSLPAFAYASQGNAILGIRDVLKRHILSRLRMAIIKHC